MNEDLQRCKLLITIVNYGMARKVIKASREAGAEGGTTLLGKGTQSHKLTKFLGIPVEPEKEIVLTLTREDRLESILQSVVAAAKLNKPGHGIAFVLDIKKVTGIYHLYMPVETASTKRTGGTRMADEGEVIYDLIVTIVNKGSAEDVVNSSRKAGAEGGTILSGRGTGVS